MLSVKENERLTHIGPGTDMGTLFRRYWHPIAGSVEMDDTPTKAMRILGEDLVLFKDRSGNLGLIQESCPHRRVNLLYGIPEEHGLRCPYHGWLFDETGKCLEMPAEAPDSTFKDRVVAKTYPVKDHAGFIWAYLGPDPAPLIPNWDLPRQGQRVPADRRRRHPLQLAPVHGELRGPRSPGVAPRLLLPVGPGAVRHG